MDIVSDIKTWLSEQTSTSGITITMDNLDDTGTMIRGDPSSAVVTEFVDGSTTGQQQVTFYAKSASPATAKSNLQAIYDEMNQPEIALTDALCIRVSPASLPAFVSKEKTGESNYSFTVNIDFDNNTEIGV